MNLHWMKLIILLLIAFLFGRVDLFVDLLPFALPMVIAFHDQSKRLSWIMGLCALGGAFTLHFAMAEKLLIELVFFGLLYLIFGKMTDKDSRYAPVYVFMSILLTQSVYLVLLSTFTVHLIMINAVELTLAVLFTVLVINAQWLLVSLKRPIPPKMEEMISLLIVVSCAIGGLHDVMIAGVSAEHVMQRVLVILIASVAGAPFGALIGVICGMIGSLPEPDDFNQLGLLAVGGFFAGLMQKGKIHAIIVGFWMGTVAISVYYHPSPLFNFILENIAVTALFLLIPDRFRAAVAVYAPGSIVNQLAQHEYARRIRELASSRIRQFAAMFRHLGINFQELSTKNAEPKQNRMEQTIQTVIARHCTGCTKRSFCWENDFSGTIQFLGNVIVRAADSNGASEEPIPDSWREQCIKSETVWNTIELTYKNFSDQSYWKQQVQESRLFVSHQLFGVSQVMDHLADEICEEKETMLRHEDQILHAIAELNLEIRRTELVCLERGQVQIELEHRILDQEDFCRTVLAPIFSAILQENIVLSSESAMDGRGRMKHAIFQSAKRMVIETGMAGAAKNGGVLSGDSFSTMDLGEGKMAIAISDGMGNGQRAREESSAALTILQQMMQSGVDEQLAVRMVNSILLLRSSEEMYATVDLACIDLNKGSVTFLKNGSIPSYILRGQEIISVSSNTLPVGIVDQIEVQPMRFQLIPGDRLLLMSDGVYDSSDWLTDQERWMKQTIGRLNIDDPQAMADQLMDTVVHQRGGQIQDDLTILVAKVGNYRKDWAAVSWADAPRYRKPRVVSGSAVYK